MGAGMTSQLVQCQHAIRGNGMRMQVALEQTRLLMCEGQLVGNHHSLRSDLVCAKNDVPLPWIQAGFAVARRGKGFTDLETQLVRSGCAYLGAVRGYQTQVDDVAFHPRVEMTVFRADPFPFKTRVFVGKTERFRIRRHVEWYRQVLTFLLVPDIERDLLAGVDDLLLLPRDRSQDEFQEAANLPVPLEPIVAGIFFIIFPG